MKPCKHCFFIIAFTLIISACCGQTLTGRVVKISDGDTFTLLTENRTQVKIRLAEIDCPERGQPFGTQAKQALGRQCFNQTVTVNYRKIDGFKRVLGYVYTADGTQINEWMVANGYAWQFEKYSKSSTLRQLQATAQRRRLGLWSDANPVEPWLWRKAKRG